MRAAGSESRACRRAAARHESVSGRSRLQSRPHAGCGSGRENRQNTERALALSSTTHAAPPASPSLSRVRTNFRPRSTTSWTSVLSFRRLLWAMKLTNCGSRKRPRGSRRSPNRTAGRWQTLSRARSTASSVKIAGRSYKTNPTNIAVSREFIDRPGLPVVPITVVIGPAAGTAVTGFRLFPRSFFLV